jgi:hypothetical protein
LAELGVVGKPQGSTAVPHPALVAPALNDVRFVPKADILDDTW